MNKEIERYIQNDFKKLCDSYSISAEEIFNILKEQEKKDAELELVSFVEENKKYVGKCYREQVSPYNGLFPHMYRYYRVISERSSNKYSVSCLCFDEKPHYWFDYNSHKMHSLGDYFLGYFDFEPIWIDDIPIKDLDKIKEIEPSLFKYELHRLGHKIADMDFPADHYRMGGKLPGDKEWKEERKKVNE